jgi:hypothetical protein
MFCGSFIRKDNNRNGIKKMALWLCNFFIINLNQLKYSYLWSNESLQAVFNLLRPYKKLTPFFLQTQSLIHQSNVLKNNSHLNWFFSYNLINIHCSIILLESLYHFSLIYMQYTNIVKSISPSHLFLSNFFKYYNSFLVVFERLS